MEIWGAFAVLHRLDQFQALPRSRPYQISYLNKMAEFSGKLKMDHIPAQMGFPKRNFLKIFVNGKQH